MYANNISGEYVEGDQPYGNYWVPTTKRPSSFYNPIFDVNGNFVSWQINQAASDAAATKIQHSLDATNFCSADALAQQLKTATPAQITTYVTNNVTDLASARVILIKLACILSFVLRNNGF